MTRNRTTAAIAAAVIAITAVVLLTGGAGAPVTTAEGVVAWWLTQNVPVVLAVWAGAAVAVAAVWAVTFGRTRRQHRDG